MLQIRHGVFETNSSSTHSITMCSKNTYDAWENGELYFNDGWWGKEVENRDKKLVTRDEAIKLLIDSKSYNEQELHNYSQEKLERIFIENNIYSNKSYWDEVCEYYETYVDTCETDGGETIVAFGYYGYDG